MSSWNVAGALVFTAGLLFAGQAVAAPINEPPPNGAILDLSGSPITAGYTEHTVNFIATSSTTNLSFALRDDPWYVGLDDVSVTLFGGGANLVTNGGFESGLLGSSAPIGWTYLNTFGAVLGGIVTDTLPQTSTSGGANSGSNYYQDGAIQAYDGITQEISTTEGAEYTLSFYLTAFDVGSAYSALSTNGNTTNGNGNGIDVLAYAGTIPTAAVPEPITLSLFGAGLAGVTALRRRKKKVA